MNIAVFEKREQALKLRAKIMQTEEERLNVTNTRSISEARKENQEAVKIKIPLVLYKAGGITFLTTSIFLSSLFHPTHLKVLLPLLFYFPSQRP